MAGSYVPKRRAALPCWESPAVEGSIRDRTLVEELPKQADPKELWGGKMSIGEPCGMAELMRLWIYPLAESARYYMAQEGNRIDFGYTSPMYYKNWSYSVLRCPVVYVMNLLQGRGKGEAFPTPQLTRS